MDLRQRNFKAPRASARFCRSADLEGAWREAPMTATINEKILEERLSALETAHTWSPRVISRLEALIRSGADEDLFRINPIKFAADKGMAEAETIDLFLYAAAQGLFEMNWMLLCSLCGCITESFGSLNRVHDHHHCNLCQTNLD